MLVAVCILAAGAAVAFVVVAGGRSETLMSQEVGSASDVTATPLSGNVRARQGADRLLQRERTGYPCGAVPTGAVPTLGCPLSTPVQMVPLFLVRDSAETIRAFIGMDPRNGCRLLWLPTVQGGLFNDPCHGSLYDRQGRVVGGPSPWNLNEWAVEVKDGNVFVDPSRIITGEGASTLTHPPRPAEAVQTCGPVQDQTTSAACLLLPGTLVDIIVANGSALLASTPLVRVRLESGVMSAQYGNPLLFEADARTQIEPSAPSIAATGVKAGARVQVAFDGRAPRTPSGAYLLTRFVVMSAGLGAVFDATPPYPGYAWTREGRSVKPEEFGTIAGPGHCGWQSATFLSIGWPVGTLSTSSAQARQYIRDPNGVVRAMLRDRLDLNAKVPSDARPTGYTHDSVRVYLSPTDQDEAIYIVGPFGAERWPRSDPVTLCD